MHDAPFQVFVVVGAILVLGLALAWMGLRRLLSRRLLAGSTNFFAGLFLLLIAFTIAGIISNFYTYVQLTTEQLVGTIDFQKYGDQEYIAQLTQADGDAKRYTVFGDECQLDARILKWKGSGNLLGFETLYRLERLSGRYSETLQAETSRRSIHTLSEQAGLDIWSIINRFDSWLPWVDAIYGNAVYVPMQSGANYRVTVTGSGLAARPQNLEAKQAIKAWK